jgi:hypothetical protein
MRWVALLGALLLVAGCGGDEAASITTTAASSATTTVAPLTSTTTTPPSTTTTADLAAGGAALGEPGPYGVGRTFFETTDATREGRLVRVEALYPADISSSGPGIDISPDTSGAPYPVLLGDEKIVDVLGPHLASHGFVVLGVLDQATWMMIPSLMMIDQPLDQLTALNGLEALDDHLLTGLADTSRAGALGYSFGSQNALMLAGARIDPDYYLSACAARPEGWSLQWFEYACGGAERWDTFAAYAAEVGIATPEGLWEPMGDERIKAVMPGGPEGFELMGPEGLAGVTVPALLMAARNDQFNEYSPATTRLFEYYPNADLITFMGADHRMIFESDAVSQIGRFAVAFFGYHLAGRDDYARYLTKDFVENVAPGLGATDSFTTLVWGVAER